MSHMTSVTLVSLYRRVSFDLRPFDPLQAREPRGVREITGDDSSGRPVLPPHLPLPRQPEVRVYIMRYRISLLTFISGNWCLLLLLLLCCVVIVVVVVLLLLCCCCCCCCGVVVVVVLLLLCCVVVVSHRKQSNTLELAKLLEVCTLPA